MGPVLSKERPSTKAIRLLSYNVEWGFLTVPDDVTSDSCGHVIPHTPVAQNTHLTLISKNIGISNPDICFLQEIGSISALEYIANSLTTLFSLHYSIYYSNGPDSGNQGVGLLIKTELMPECAITTIPNFKLNRAVGVIITFAGTEYKLIGVHLKSLYDQKIQKDEKEQEEQIQSVLDWVGDSTNVIFCGDFNNIPSSGPIKKVTDAGYLDILSSDKYIANITGNTNTEFHGHPGKESGSRIDYIFKSASVNLISSHIIDFQRESPIINPELRGESSDHLPIMGIFSL
jgi:endonuclease/exonuclease/phosphatase family metal-dependent hydrolase